MAYMVQCNRCKESVESHFYPMPNIGTYGPPPGWLTVKYQKIHLCPSCALRALEPEERNKPNPHTHRFYTDDFVAPTPGLREVCIQGVCASLYEKDNGHLTTLERLRKQDNA